MFVPLHDHNGLEHVKRPYVNYGLILTNVIVFVLLQHLGFGDAATASAYSHGLVPSVFLEMKELPAELQVLPDYASIFTYAFLHGDIWHLGGNMLFLWVFGDNIEDALGHVRYFLFYILCATAGGLAYTFSNFGSDVPLVGASGAVAGVIAGYLMLHPKVMVWVLALGKFPVPLPAVVVLGFWVGYQVFSAAFGPESQIAWSAHIGGILAGCLLVVFMRRRGVPLFD